MKRLSDNAIEIVNELHTERLAYESEYVPIIDALNRLAEYEDAEEQGLLLRLPCKVGDSYFAIKKFCDEHGELEEPVEHWDSDCYGCNLPCNAELEVKEGKFNSIHHIIAERKGIGVSIFLTREEAEKALEDA